MAGTPTPKSAKRDRRRRAAFIGGIAVLVVGTAVAARWGAMRAKSAAPEAMKTDLSVTVSPQTPATTAPAAPTHAPRAHATPSAAEKPAAPKPAGAKTTSAKEGAAPSNLLIVANGPAPAKAPAIAPTAADASHVNQAPVTITGCLETTVQESEFRLTDTEGADAPKSRSWKSGFLKKSATPISLVGYSDPTGLKKLVGHRVSATGMLTSGELHLRSYKPAGASCSN